MSSNGSTDVRTTTVIITALTAADETIVMEVPIPHQPGVTQPLILSAALQVLRQNGGMLTDGPEGSLNFYPLLLLKHVHLKASNIELATVVPMRPQLVQ